MRRVCRTIGIALISIAAVACVRLDPPRPNVASSPNVVTNIGATGGVLRVTEGRLAGFELFVPPGALDRDTEFRMEVVSDGADSTPAVVRLYPEGTPFRGKVRVTMPAGTEAGLKLWTRSTPSAPFEDVAHTARDVHTKAVVAWVEHFSEFSARPGSNSCACISEVGGALCSQSFKYGATFYEGWTCGGLEWGVPYDKRFTGQPGEHCSGKYAVLEKWDDRCGGDKPWYGCYDEHTVDGKLALCDADDTWTTSCKTAEQDGTADDGPFLSALTPLFNEPAFKQLLDAATTGKTMFARIALDPVSRKTRRLQEGHVGSRLPRLAQLVPDGRKWRGSAQGA